MSAARSKPATPLVFVDLTLRRAADAGDLRVGCLFPFVTRMDLEQELKTTIPGRPSQVENPAALLLALLRHAFFIDHHHLAALHCTRLAQHVREDRVPLLGDAAPAIGRTCGALIRRARNLR